MEPVLLGRRTGSLAYVLTLTDLAGNMVAMPLSGAILQRGVVTGMQTGPHF